MSDITAFNNCMNVFWRQHEGELSRFLILKTSDREKAADLLQELFLRARAHSDSFCEMENPRAWLYRTVRNMLIDEYRITWEFIELADEISQPEASPDAISTLEICLPETLQKLPEDERWLIEESDLQRRPQQELANELNISLPALKSRLLRARSSLRNTLTRLCEIESDETSTVCCHKK
ncbi:sigma-70 family RNA polymerase sigma factor [Salmonella enterica]|nr:sigma-70 family RNA polymerase sigma factor [Salmonella enterica]ECH4351475.1 sigma-70 family RNA polymerase sigma factor [Salmonella enterica]ECH7209642.1 sigma-70 family RNA polymerase sigma factor [Salmonella enterica]ECJ3254988.1 sigma-70 family RNA polymerase sigma factor [Salmonella enterica]ECK1899571.1 sigma-70 family RNA polymerase sigma factor [Salmonella enterica]